MSTINNLFFLLPFAGAVLGCAEGRAMTPKISTTSGAVHAARPTEPFRREHAVIKRHLEEMSATMDYFATGTLEAQRESMARVVRFFHEHIKPHAEWEERVLYPAVDRRVGSARDPFTASMRYEHRIVARWTDELEAIAARPIADVRAFVRRADNLLGLVWAHFEEEEEVLLPILDASMSKEQFEREIGNAHAE
jgi:hemerythrin-like domain-containing protein